VLSVAAAKCNRWKIQVYEIRVMPLLPWKHEKDQFCRFMDSDWQQWCCWQLHHCKRQFETFIPIHSNSASNHTRTTSTIHIQLHAMTSVRKKGF